MRALESALERVILLSRWLLAPLYIALICVLILFSVKAFQEVFHLFETIMISTDVKLILSILGMIDMVLVANLLVMVILSGYQTFVSEFDVDGDHEKPAWVGKIDAAALKLKLAAAIVAISSIHLLKAFMTMDPEHVDSNFLLWLVIIHLTFVVSALLLAMVDKLSSHGGHH